MESIRRDNLSGKLLYASVAELVDAADLSSDAYALWVRVPAEVPFAWLVKLADTLHSKCGEEIRNGSSPLPSTKNAVAE